MDKEILWEDCPLEEKLALMKLEERRNELNVLLKNKKITLRQWKYNRTMLRKKADELERKYDESKIIQ